MEKLILVELERANDLLTIIAMLVGVLVLAKIINILGNIASNWQLQRTDRIRNRSIDLHDQEKYSELIEYLNEKLVSYPNNATAVYWLARAYLGIEDKEKAKKYFIRLRELEPSWEQEFVSPFLNEIEGKH